MYETAVVSAPGSGGSAGSRGSAGFLAGVDQAVCTAYEYALVARALSPSHKIPRRCAQLLSRRDNTMQKRDVRS
eukprot:COSAG04_NODE_31085_length_258_cov_3.188679_1_plen_73_part_10